MGRAPCCDKTKVKRGPWSPEEDSTLKNYLQKYGTGGNWIALPHKAGLKRCGKSCRLRWLNYLRPDIKHGGFTEEEDNVILTLYSTIGSRWSVIASQLTGRTDNDVKNYWNTKLKKKLLLAGGGREKGLKIANPTAPPPAVSMINFENSSDFPVNPMNFSSAASFATFEEFEGILISDTSLPDPSKGVIQGYPGEVAAPNMLYDSTRAYQFSLPGLMEVQANGTAYHHDGLGTTSSSQEISGLSPSGNSLSKSYASRSDNGIGEETGAFLELESKSSDFDLLRRTLQEEDDDSGGLFGGFLANVSDNSPSQSN